MRNDKLPAAERTLARLTDEAKFLLVAGTDAPSQVMSITIYHILCTSCVYNRLREELQMALPNADMDACWGDLERLPYLVSILHSNVYCQLV
jgi:cytochrome P450